MTSQPADANQADSARVENRGPSITTTVPRSCSGIRSSRPFAIVTLAHRRAVRVGERDVRGDGAVVERVRPVARAVDQLVADHEVARLHGRLQRAARVRAEHAGHAELLHGPDVRPVGDPVRRELVLHAVAGDEGHRPAADVADRPAARRACRTACRRRRSRSAPGTSRSPSRRTRRSRPCVTSPSSRPRDLDVERRARSEELDAAGFSAGFDDSFLSLRSLLSPTIRRGRRLLARLLARRLTGLLAGLSDDFDFFP